MLAVTSLLGGNTKASPLLTESIDGDVAGPQQTDVTLALWATNSSANQVSSGLRFKMITFPSDTPAANTNPYSQGAHAIAFTATLASRTYTLSH